MFKFVRRLIFFSLLLVLILVLGRNLIGASLLEAALQRITHTPVSIDSVKISLLHPHVAVRDIVIRNPKGRFQEPVALKINSLEFDYTPASLLSLHPRLRQLALDVHSVNIIRNQHGEINLQRLLATPTPASSRCQIGDWTLSLENVRYLDERRDSPSPAGFKANIKNRRFRGAHTPESAEQFVLQLAIQSLPESLREQTLQQLSGALATPSSPDVLKKWRTEFSNLVHNVSPP